MKEIKFRAWDKEELIYFDLNDLWFNAIRHTKHFDDYQFMQFTGLKDKNGKEIYEGDVMTISWADGGKGWGVIRYTDENAQFHWFEQNCAGYGLISFERDVSGREVIGNIYENPELLSYPTFAVLEASPTSQPPLPVPTAQK